MATQLEQIRDQQQATWSASAAGGRSRRGNSAESMEQAMTASYANRRSFWLVKEELIEAIRAAGFGVVYEQYDFLRSAVDEDYIRRHDRSMFVGVKVAG